MSPAMTLSWCHTLLWVLVISWMVWDLYNTLVFMVRHVQSTTWWRFSITVAWRMIHQLLTLCPTISFWERWSFLPTGTILVVQTVLYVKILGFLMHLLPKEGTMQRFSRLLDFWLVTLAPSSVVGSSVVWAVYIVVGKAIVLSWWTQLLNTISTQIAISLAVYLMVSHIWLIMMLKPRWQTTYDVDVVLS